MNISELNAKLVSELREIAALIGIQDVEKLRKQELIKRIVETGDEESQDSQPASPQDAAEERQVESGHSDERPRKRLRSVKPGSEPISLHRNTGAADDESGMARTETAVVPEQNKPANGKTENHDRHDDRESGRRTGDHAGWLWFSPFLGLQLSDISG